MSLRVEPKNRTKLAAACMGVAMLSACTTLPTDPGLLDERDALLSGEVVFGEVLDTDELVSVDILETSEEMVSFVESSVGDTRLPTVKFRRILNGLSEAGYFGQTYVADITRTAADTFEQKSGNCLSYTNMFIALARNAGLDAHYQIVDVPPSWDGDAGYLIRYTHINVLMRGFGMDPLHGSEFSVDFNDVLPEPDYPRRRISDEEATALYYANRSIAKLRAGETRDAFLHLKKSIELDPDNPDLWINLGAFYAKQEAYDQALAAYGLALYYDPNNRSAISGLGRTHYLMGHHEEAERYEILVRRYRDRNPYYHFAIAQTEYDNARYESALNAINTAIDLKYRNGRFHFLKGLTEYRLGAFEEAEQSFRRAARYGNYRDLKQRYVSDLARLEPLG